MQDITWVSRVWEDALNKCVASTTTTNCISHAHREAVPAAWVLVPTKFKSIPCNLEQLLWWEDADATSFWGPVSHRGVYSQEVLAPCCSASLPCCGPACLAPPTAGLVWEAACISSACCFSRLAAGNWRQLMAYSLSGSLQACRT